MKKSLKVTLGAAGSFAVLAFGAHVYDHFAPTADAAEGHSHAHGKAEAKKDAPADRGEAKKDAHHDHGAASGESMLGNLKLNGDKKWQTDAPLRQNMKGIRDQMAAAVPQIHAGKFTNEDYAALAAGLEKSVQNMIAGCKLPPEVDAQAHFILAEIFGGADAMKKDGDRHAGAVKVVKALGAYPKFFDDAEFKPLD